MHSHPSALKLLARSICDMIAKRKREKNTLHATKREKKRPKRKKDTWGYIGEMQTENFVTFET